VYVEIKELPRTLNGKIDRKALPGLGTERSSRQQQRSKAGGRARTPVEEIVAGIWEEVLHVQGVGVEENFFESGGHSLLATKVMLRIRKALGVELALRVLFEAPTVAAMAGRIEQELHSAGGGKQELPLERVERTGELPLSYAQQRLWFVAQLEPGNPSYNMPFAIRLRGKLDGVALERSLNEIVRRHEVLRTRFPERDGIAVQQILPAVELGIEVRSLMELAAGERESEALRLAREEMMRPFDLAQDWLLRVKLLRLDETDYVLLVTMHHIVSDGWSIGILVREFNQLYAAYSQGLPPGLPELPVQYADFSLWQRKWLHGPVLQNQIDYWRAELQELVSLDLPTDRVRPAMPSHRGHILPFALSSELTARLKQFSREQETTLFMVLLAMFQVLLARYSGQKEIAVGTDVANRNRLEVEHMIGFFVNQLVLRTRIENGATVSELLAQVRKTTLGAYSHQDVPFEKLVEELQPERDMSHAPIFQAKLVMQNVVRQKPNFGELCAERFEVHAGRVTMDLELIFAETPDGFAGVLHYARDLFDEWRIAQFMKHFKRLLENAISNENEPLSQLSYMSSEEVRELVEGRRGERREWGGWRDVVEGFEEQVKRRGEAVAVEHEGREVSYRELEKRANQLGRYLRGLGVGAEVKVGLCVRAGVEMVVGVLGILKAGGAYVPLDAGNPGERLGAMMRLAQVGVVVTEREVRGRLPNMMWVQVVSVDEEREEIGREGEERLGVGVEEENLAYVIFTSGSTGEPKGVGVTHGGLRNYVKYAQERYEVEKGRGAALHTSLGFDLTVTSLYPVLLSGGCVEVIGEGGVEEVVKRLAGGEYSLLKLTPSHVQMMNRLLGEGGEGRRRGVSSWTLLHPSLSDTLR